MHHLEMPDSLTVADIDCHEAVGEQVVAGAVTAVVSSSWCGEGNVDITQFLVCAQATPGAKVAGIAPAVIAPGLGTKLAFPGHGMESPQ